MMPSVCLDGVRQEKFEPVIVETDPEFIDTNVERMTSLTTGETGNLGVTYMPLSVNPQKMEKADASNPDIIHININPTLSKVGAAEIFSHEGYAHAVLYVSNPSNRWAAMHQGTGWGPDPNTDLFEKTIRARKETLNNMKK